MSTLTFNTVSWFQIGSDKPEEVKRFYGDLFGWNFVPDPGSGDYDLISYPDSEMPSGGVAHSADASDNHAVFLVLVPDVAATAAETERLGGKVIQPPTTTPNGLVFAYLLDTSGNRFGIFTPPSS
ncbi:VOC family protein [Nocardia sp. 2]|uniref:VOC family protein n=1 Tax=Nocardia acididurans TaxID=2802282 RepID=A0ABS1M1W8_9NOCA|nr:VOC family protein [Nocardia acididurans]MBL1074653.1 VOC family protein [Nocardia acididurans]